MKPIKRIFNKYLFTSVILIVFPLSVFAVSNYKFIKLPYGVSIELPKNWLILTKTNRITLDSYVQSKNENNGFAYSSSDLSFAANYYDNSGNVAALINVRFYQDIDISQNDAITAESGDIAELDRLIHDSLIKSGQINNFSIINWLGTKKKKINNLTAFISEYERSAINNNGNTKVRLIRVFNNKKSFTLTISYKKSQEKLLRPICDHIILTLHI